MTIANDLTGKYVLLRSIREEDAARILEVRNDSKINRFLPYCNVSESEQKEWIRSQQKREGDYYFGIWSTELFFLGTIRVYNIQGEIGETGSFVSKGNGFQNMEAKLLIEKFSYNELSLKQINNLVRGDNSNMIRLSEMFGVSFDDPFYDENGVMWLRGRNTVENSKKKHLEIEKMIYRGYRNG